MRSAANIWWERVAFKERLRRYLMVGGRDVRLRPMPHHVKRNVIAREGTKICVESKEVYRP